MTYDNLSRNLSKTVNDEAGTQSITTSVTYDSNGNVLTQKDGNGNVTTLTYDLLDRLASSTNALGQKTFNTYDALHNQSKYPYDGNH